MHNERQSAPDGLAMSFRAHLTNDTINEIVQLFLVHRQNPMPSHEPVQVFSFEETLASRIEPVTWDFSADRLEPSSRDAEIIRRPYCIQIPVREDLRDAFTNGFANGPHDRLLILICRRAHLEQSVPDCKATSPHA